MKLNDLKSRLLLPLFLLLVVGLLSFLLPVYHYYYEFKYNGVFSEYSSTTSSEEEFYGVKSLWDFIFHINFDSKHLIFLSFLSD